MNAQRKFVTSLLLLVLLFTEACNKKKAAVPPHAQAPTLAVKLPDEIPENPEAPTPEVAAVPVVPPPVKTKPKKPARTAAKKTSPPASAAASPAPALPSPPATNNQTVAGLRPPHTAAQETTPDMAIAAAMPSAQVLQQKEDTARMVDATENALKNTSRPLTDEEKAMRTQIQSYLLQSRKATADGDFERAFNLAKKAQLLAEALTKK